MADCYLPRVAVLGAGVMGVQIAALLAATGRQVYLLDLPDESGADGRARRAIETALKSRPPAFYEASMARNVLPGSFDDLPIDGVEWVIEAVVEDMQVKRALLERLDDGREQGAIISSNTSGLSIAGLVAGRSPAFARRFMGVHFFNPPRYMKLVELVAAPHTDVNLFDRMRLFLQNELGKGVVVARDRPNFIANRLGVFTLMVMLQLMEEQDLLVEEVDALSGPLMGRPASATLRLCDLIGLDTLAHVAATATRELPDDPWRERFVAPPFIERMLAAGLLGAKSAAGFYRKGKKGLQALDLQTLEYRDIRAIDMGNLQGVKGPPSERVNALWQDTGRWGALGRRHLSEVLSYAAWHAEEMAGDIVPVDRAMRWGFNWELGPFELWDAIGLDPLQTELADQGATWPPLLAALDATAARCFYTNNGGGDETRSFSANKKEHLIAEVDPATRERQKLSARRTLHGNDGAYLVELEKGLGALVFCAKMNALGPDVLEIVRYAVEEAPFAGLILCGTQPHFSIGADLRYIAQLIDGNDFAALQRFLIDFQHAVGSLKRAPFPVVAAVRGLSLGGGCEFALAADARVISAETRMGLVETKVGLVPAGGGVTALARRADADCLLDTFNTIFSGNFSDHAFQARNWGLLDAADSIELADDLLLEKASEKLQYMIENHYVRAEEEPIAVLGSEGIMQIEAHLDAQRAEGKLSEHDVVVGRNLARILCGGGGSARRMAAAEILELEREVFLQLCATEATRQRIAHMLKTGKPLKN